MQSNLELEESLLVKAPSDSPKTNNECISYFIKAIKCIWNVVSHIILWSITSEIILLITVYPHQKIFFNLSLIWLIIGTTITSIITMVINSQNNQKCYLYIPTFNSLLFTYLANDSNENYMAKTMDILLTIFMTIPLYIINLAYLLNNISTYNEIPIQNAVQIMISILNIVINPIKFILVAYEEANGTYTDTVTKLKIFLISLFCFGPILLIEAIHFFPFLFFYYVESAIGTTDLIIVLLIFNIAKFIFIIHHWKKIVFMDHSDTIEPFNNPYLLCLLMIFIYITIPLVPYLFVMFHKQKTVKIRTLFENGCCSSTAKYYWSVIMYLFIAYGVSTVYIIVKVGFNNLSQHTQSLFVVIFLLIIGIAATFPLSFKLLKRNDVFTDI